MMAGGLKVLLLKILSGISTFMVSRMRLLILKGMHKAHVSNNLIKRTCNFEITGSF